MAGAHWAAQAGFDALRAMLNYLLALTILLIVLWSKLHGTALSLRLAGMPGLAYTGSFFVAKAFGPPLGAALHAPSHAYSILGVEANMLNMTLTFTLLLISVLLTFGPRD